MSSSIWTRCAGDSEIRPLRLTPWRVVEAQHQVSTRKLVGSDAEQRLLEELIDRVKPPTLAAPARHRLHYLLFTPFRYPPLAHGSRFGTKLEPGIWYGAATRGTAFAEVAYYRMVFLEGTRAELGEVAAELSAFRVTARTRRGVDLTVAPFASRRRQVADPASYVASQALGRAMRGAGVELFRYPSARDPSAGGVGIAAFTPAVFGGSVPTAFETWRCIATRATVEFARRDYFASEAHAFTREQFLVDGALPVPAV